MGTVTPLVSLCIPTYNRARFLGTTIESVLAQTFPDLELVIVNDCSPDSTDEVVASFNDPRIRYIKNPSNLGVPANYNRTLELGRGEFLVLLEDHDVIEPRYVDSLVDLMRRYPSIGFASTAIEVIDEKGLVTERYLHDFPGFVPGREMLRYLARRTDCPFSLTTFMRRSVLEKVTPWFDARYWWYADLFLWWRLLAISDFGYVNEPLLKFRAREEGHTLAELFWKTSLCVDQLHQENWRLVHPRPSAASIADRVAYEWSKFKNAAGTRLGRKRRGLPWTSDDRRSSREYLSLPAAAALEVLGLLPVSVIEKLRGRRPSPHAVLEGPGS
jgi:glycosyltransferase involved in cell wall biosynthesis